MTQRSCDLCSNTAVIHDTIMHGGVVKVRHLCRVHGLKVWRHAQPVDGKKLSKLMKDPVFETMLVQSQKSAGKSLSRRGDSSPPGKGD